MSNVAFSSLRWMKTQCVRGEMRNLLLIPVSYQHQWISLIVYSYPQKWVEPFYTDHVMPLTSAEPAWAGLRANGTGLMLQFQIPFAHSLTLSFTRWANSLSPPLAHVCEVTTAGGSRPNWSRDAGYIHRGKGPAVCLLKPFHFLHREECLANAPGRTFPQCGGNTNRTDAELKHMADGKPEKERRDETLDLRRLRNKWTWAWKLELVSETIS